MVRIQKHYTLAEAVAETTKVEPITLPKDTGPWLLVEAELDLSVPARPIAAGISATVAAFGITKAQPANPSIAAAGAVSSTQIYRAIGDQLMVVGPYRWDGAEMLQLEGEYYYAWLAVRTWDQAVPAVGTVEAILTFVTPDELT